jgi:thiol-disulfide isomerase/thioredoxin
MCVKCGIGDVSIMACLAVAFLGVCGGCGSEPPAQAPAAAAPATPPAQADPLPVTIRLVDYAEVEAELAKHAGKVVVLDCWSTSCPPCIKEFPGLIKLQKTFGERVVCLSLSFDYEGIGAPDEVVPRVEGFLRDVGAGTIVNLVAREDADALYEKMNLVSVPAVFVYKPDGTLARTFDDDMASKELGRPFTYEDITAAVEECLAR